MSLAAALNCTGCTSAMDEPAASPETSERFEIPVWMSPEAAAAVLGINSSSSYSQRRSALVKAAISHSKTLGSLMPLSYNEAIPSSSFHEAWMAFNSLTHRGVDSTQWQADDLFPQLSSGESVIANAATENIPMPRLMTAECIEVSEENEFVCQFVCATRHGIVRRSYSELEELDAHLRNTLKLHLPFALSSLNIRSQTRSSVTGFLTRALSARPSEIIDPYELTDEPQVELVVESQTNSPATKLTNYLSSVLQVLREKDWYSEKVMDFFELDKIQRKRFHCEDMKLVLREIFDLECLADYKHTEDFAVDIDWHETFLAFLRSDTDYYNPPGPLRNAQLATIMAQHAINKNDQDSEVSDYYILHSPAKFAFIQLVYGKADVVLRIPLKR